MMSRGLTSAIRMRRSRSRGATGHCLSLYSRDTQPPGAFPRTLGTGQSEIVEARRRRFYLILGHLLVLTLGSTSVPRRHCQERVHVHPN